MGCLYFLALYALCFFSVLCGNVNSQTCDMRQGSTCVCDMSDGSGTVDLSPISSTSGAAFFSKFKGGGTEYSYNPCTSFTDGKCASDVAVCQADDGGIICGKQSTAAFEFQSAEPLVLTLTYTGGQPDNFMTSNQSQLQQTDRAAVVTLICDFAEHDISFDTEDPRLTYKFVLKTKYACAQAAPPPPVSKSKSLSVGTVLLIVAPVAFFVYIVAGILVMHFRYGATGVELLPNLEFWKGLPGLIKAGAIFLFCCGRAQGNYEQL